MTKYFFLLTFLSGFNLPGLAQRISLPDSLQIMKSVDSIFNILKQADYSSFKKSSTKNIYCLPCFTHPNPKKPYIIDRKEFFNNHLDSIRNSDYFIRAINAKQVIFDRTPNDLYHRADIIVLFTIYNQNELAPGHEGDQFGLYLQKHNKGYRFSGLETIP